MFEIQEQLEQYKLEHQSREVEFKKKEAALEAKDLELQNHLVMHSKFLQEKGTTSIIQASAEVVASGPSLRIKYPAANTLEKGGDFNLQIKFKDEDQPDSAEEPSATNNLVYSVTIVPGDPSTVNSYLAKFPAAVAADKFGFDIILMDDFNNTISKNGEFDVDVLMIGLTNKAAGEFLESVPADITWVTETGKGYYRVSMQPDFAGEYEVEVVRSGQA